MAKQIAVIIPENLVETENNLVEVSLAEPGNCILLPVGKGWVEIDHLWRRRGHGD